MSTLYYTASSLDGYIADSQHSLEWLMSLGDPEQSSYPEFIAGIGAMAMGAHTYEWLLRHLSAETSGEMQPWPYEQPCWVFTSRDLPRVSGADLRFVRGDVRPVHRELVAAAGGRHVWIVGGGELAGQFYDRQLLDELIVQVAPVTLGGGAALFPRRVTSPPLRLTATNQLGRGFVELRYAIDSASAIG